MGRRSRGQRGAHAPDGTRRGPVRDAILAGSAAFESTMVKLGVAGRGDFTDVHLDMRRSWRRKFQLPDNLPVLVEYRAHAAQRGAARQALENKVGIAKTGWLDTHPSASERVRRARRAAEAGYEISDAPARELFENFDSLSRLVTLAHYEDDLKVPVTRRISSSRWRNSCRPWRSRPRQSIRPAVPATSASGYDPRRHLGNVGRRSTDSVGSNDAASHFFLLPGSVFSVIRRGAFPRGERQHRCQRKGFAGTDETTRHQPRLESSNSAALSGVGRSAGSSSPTVRLAPGPFLLLHSSHDRTSWKNPPCLVLNRHWQAIAARSPAEAFCQLMTGAACGLDIADGNLLPVRSWKEWLRAARARARSRRAHGARADPGADRGGADALRASAPAASGVQRAGDLGARRAALPVHGQAAQAGRGEHRPMSCRVRAAGRRAGRIACWRADRSIAARPTGCRRKWGCGCSRSRTPRASCR